MVHFGGHNFSDFNSQFTWNKAINHDSHIIKTTNHASRKMGLSRFTGNKFCHSHFTENKNGHSRITQITLRPPRLCTPLNFFSQIQDGRPAAIFDLKTGTFCMSGAGSQKFTNRFLLNLVQLWTLSWGLCTLFDFCSRIQDGRLAAIFSPQPFGLKG